MLLRDPFSLAAAARDYYFSQVTAAADSIAGSFPERRVVLCGGASGSGKTTTAHNIAKSLERHGLHGEIISLDNFYFGIDKAPRLPDGSYDYESVDALDLAGLDNCIGTLLRDGTAMLPVFDFIADMPSEEGRQMDIDPNDVIILEGIHAQNPRLKNAVAGVNTLNLFISVERGFFDNGRQILSPKDIRLIRRLVRDLKFRGTSFSNTHEMWRQVSVSEDVGIFPFKGEADIIIDTFHCFEPCLMKNFVMKGAAKEPENPSTRRLLDALGRFACVGSDVLSQDCLLHEFVG